MRWLSIPSGGTPVKRFLVRLAALGGIGTLGFLAIAQAQRFGADDATIQPDAAAQAPEPEAIASEPITKSAAAANDPFAVLNAPDKAAETVRQAASSAQALLEEARQSFPQETATAVQTPAPRETATAMRGQDEPSTGGRYAQPTNPRYAEPDPTAHPGNQPSQQPAGRYGDPFADGGNEPLPARPRGEPTPAVLPPDQGDAAGQTGAASAMPAEADPRYAGSRATEPLARDPLMDRYGANEPTPAAEPNRFTDEPAADPRYADPLATARGSTTAPSPLSRQEQPTGGNQEVDRMASPGRMDPPARLSLDDGNPLRRMPDSTLVSTQPGMLDRGASLPGGPSGTGRPGDSRLEGPQTPSISIEKFAPPEMQIGKPAVMEIVVRNLGQVRAQSVTVQDEIPLKTRLVSTSPEAQQSADGTLVWELGDLDPGAERTVKMELVATEEGELGSVAQVYFAAASSAKTVATRPELRLEVAAPKETMIGSDATLVIKVSNPGTGPATGVVLRELVPDHFTHPGGGELEYEVGELKPGESRELELTLKAIKAGPAVNTLTARGDGILQAKSVTELNVVAPALEVGMTGPKRRFLEREAVYTVNVANPGTAAAREVELVTYLPKGLEFVRADNYGEYDPQTRAVRWSLEELPANQAGSVTLTTMPVEAGEHKVLIEGSAEQGLAAREEQAIVVEGVAAIHFQVMDVEDPIEVNGETTYEVRVVNQGSKAATDVQLEAVLPPQMKPLSAEGPVRYEMAGTTVLFDKLPRLAPKADTTYRIRVKGLQSGDMRIRVRVATNEITTPIVKEESTRVYADE